MESLIENVGCDVAYYHMFGWGIPAGVVLSQRKVANGLTRLCGERSLVSRRSMIA